MKSSSDIMAEEKPKKVEEKKPRKLLGVLRREKPVPKPVREEKEVDALGILKYVLMTEKSIRMIEADNKMIFVVDRKSSKKDVKAAFEKAFNSPVAMVRIHNDQKGRKRAFIKLKTAGAAGEIAIRLGII